MRLCFFIPPKTHNFPIIYAISLLVTCVCHIIKVLYVFQNKMDENCDNVYNQNFKGLYCVCSKPYPDPDDEVS